jgi:hypothetical protein
MREPRNPFRLRASEHIESDATFVRLFGPGALDLLNKQADLDKVRILRSAPGGGKTSLLRLFTPGSLLALHAYRTRDDCKDLYQRMCEMGALAEEGPRVLGVMVSCDRNYDALADMGLEAGRQQRMLFGLLDARLTLAALRSALLFVGMDFPRDLARIRVGLPTGNGVVVAPTLQLPCTGAEMYDWAKKVEEGICEVIDGFEGMADACVCGADSLGSPTILRADNVWIDDRKIAQQMVMMLDDVNKLTAWQREKLVGTVLNLRCSTGIWIAERLEALGRDELLGSGGTEGRDYTEVTLLEGYWKRNQKRFENVAVSIADRRSRHASDVEIGSFGTCLQDSLDVTEWEGVYGRAIEVMSGRVREMVSSRPQFRGWLAAREQIAGTPREQAVAWRSLEILIEREVRKGQKTFAFELDAETLEEKDDSSLRTAAELFIANEFGVPFYFGCSMLAKLSSSNFEQFLRLSGDLFEEVLSTALVNPSRFAELAPKRQEAIIRKAAQNVWDEIPRRTGRAVRGFLEAIGQFSRWYTYRPSAPNDPGVNGIAVSMADRDKLMDSTYLEKNPQVAQLGEVLAGALANNLLDADLDYKCKGERWMVLNLNRLLCVRFSLPLNYGKFKEKTLGELVGWLERGFKEPSGEAALL